MNKVDMSSEAILRRLKTVDRLRELCLALMKAKKKQDDKERDTHDIRNKRDCSGGKDD